jgi:hypothetical protein
MRGCVRKEQNVRQDEVYQIDTTFGDIPQDRDVTCFLTFSLSVRAQRELSFLFESFYSFAETPYQLRPQFTVEIRSQEASHGFLKLLFRTLPDSLRAFSYAVRAGH